MPEKFIHRQKPWDPIVAVAFSFWAALTVLSALGIRYPLAMLLLILMQIVVSHYIKKSGDQWRSVPQGAAQ